MMDPEVDRFGGFAADHDSVVACKFQFCGKKPTALGIADGVGQWRSCYRSQSALTGDRGSRQDPGKECQNIFLSQWISSRRTVLEDIMHAHRTPAHVGPVKRLIRLLRCQGS